MARGGNVNIVVDAQTAGLIQGWLQARNNLQNYQQQLGQVGQVGQRAGQQAGGAFANFGREIGRAGLAMAGLSTVTQSASTFMQILRNEYEALSAARAKSADVKVGAGIAKLKAMQAMTETPDFSRQQMLEQGDAMAAGIGMSRESFFTALQQVFAAGGTMSPRQAMESAVSTAQLSKYIALSDDSESLASGTMATMLLAREFGFRPDQAAGANLRFFRSAFVRDLDSFSKQMVPGAAALTQFSTDPERRDDPRFLMSLMSGLTQVTADTSGRSVRTGAAVFGSNLAAYTAQKGFRGTIEDQIRFVMTDPAMINEFAGILSTKFTDVGAQLEGQNVTLDPDTLEKLTASGLMGGEARLRAAFAGIFDPNSRTNQEIAEAAKKLGNLATAFQEEKIAADRDMNLPDFDELRMRQIGKGANEIAGDRPQVTTEEVVNRYQQLRKDLGMSQFVGWVEDNVSVGKLGAMRRSWTSPEDALEIVLERAVRERKVQAELQRASDEDRAPRMAGIRREPEQIVALEKFIQENTQLLRDIRGRQDRPQKVEIVNPPVQQAPGALPDGGL